MFAYVEAPNVAGEAILARLDRDPVRVESDLAALRADKLSAGVARPGDLPIAELAGAVEDPATPLGERIAELVLLLGLLNGWIGKEIRSVLRGGASR